jgi:glycosyltransferase involved in cell wall biosynthesis
MKRPVVLVLGPHRDAVSGVTTHVNLLLASPLAETFSLVHFQVGSEGRAEGRISRLVRLAVSPFCLAIAIVTRGAAIVHLNTSLDVRAYWRDLTCMIVAKLCGTRVLCQVHGGSLPQQFAGRSRIATAILRATLRVPDAIVVLTQCELEAYRAFVPGQSIGMIQNAIDASPFTAQARARAGAETALRLTYMGRLIKDKGLYELLEGFRLSRALGIEARLVIAGSGPEEAPLRRHVAEAALAGEVLLPGPVFGERKVAMLVETDVFVLPTYHVEGLPYALLEAMAAGAAVITTRVAAIPDVVIDGVHGLFVPPRDALAIARAIVRLASDRESLARMSAACRRRIADSYSVERLSKAFFALYSELCAARRMKALIRS